MKKNQFLKESDVTAESVFFMMQGESNSISNQKRILETYAKQNGFSNLQWYTDDERRQVLKALGISAAAFFASRCACRSA